MTDEPLARRLEPTLRPDPARTVLRPFDLSTEPDRDRRGGGRLSRIVDQVRGLSDDDLDRGLAFTRARIEGRHRDGEAVLLRNADAAAELVPAVRDLDEARRLLFGGYVTEEYAFESAALFNPSAILHPDQEGLGDDEVRLLLSLRGIGEGHISSVTFRSAVWAGGDRLRIEDASGIAVSPEIEERPGGGARLTLADSRHESESVLFPVLANQIRGLEDVRLTRLVEPDGRVRYVGTFTALDPGGARMQMLEGRDFRTFELWPVTGPLEKTKGGGIFPRPVDGRYLMVARPDGENLHLARSDDLADWEVGERILGPAYGWEFAQIGNCGAPIELDEGWLLLTHGVGTIRNYAIGACLLDRDDPSRVLKRMAHPLLRPEDIGRDGYVPNVVYSCGGIVRNGELLLPYGVADTYTAFAVVDVARLLAAMEAV